MQGYLGNLIYVSLFSFSFLLLHAPRGQFNVIVTKVIDGDTILVNGKNKIRLAGIDSPELKQMSFDRTPIGKNAKDWLSHKIINKRVELRVLGKGFYGRLLGEIYLKGKFINKKIVSAGYALSYEKEFLFYEFIARKKRKGMWNTFGFYSPKVFRKLITKRN